MKNFSFRERQANLQKLETDYFDLIIVGGGINGAGVARDAASRGMKVALVEASDFSSGTSSRSSKLIHGGLRYLENFEFKLVFEALNERTRLFEIAPHLVHPLRFMLPLYNGGRVGMLKMGLGMWLYDALACFQAPEMHERLNAKETLQRMPILNSEGLLGSYVYSDAYMDDDRLVLETLRSAHDQGAVCVNYTKSIKSLCSDKGQIEGIQCEDFFSKKIFSIRGHHIVSTVGPWTDLVAPTLLKNWKSFLRPTKGIHLTLPHHSFPITSAVVMEEGKRIVFAIPRHDMVIIGTTDTDFNEAPESVVANKDDVQYLLNVAKKYFSGAHLQVKDIIATYAGVRPLVRDHSTSEGKTSREHTIVTDPCGLTVVAGGKYTTYRLIAKEVVEKVLESFSFEDRIRFERSNTNAPLNSFATKEALFKSEQLMEKWHRETHVPMKSIKSLIDRHGLESEKILFSNSSSLSVLELEAIHAIENTMCLQLIDFYVRRYPLLLGDLQNGMQYLNLLSRVFQQKLGWSDQETQIQRENVKSYLKKELAWKVEINAVHN